MPAHRCYRCDGVWESPHRQPGHGETCVGCGADLRCCRNCRFYAPDAPDECTEPNAERVLDKDKRTYCEYFEIGGRSAAAQNDTGQGAARQQFDDLFKS